MIGNWIMTVQTRRVVSRRQFNSYNDATQLDSSVASTSHVNCV